MRYVDLFCGIGGFHLAAQRVEETLGRRLECVFASDIDPDCQKSYNANFGIVPYGDITKVVANQVADHEILFAGFPCQPFSIIGERRGFEDTRGTLFFDVARILQEKKPEAFILENVKMLVGHRGGDTIKTIMRSLRDIGYCPSYKVLNALHFGLPHKRERVFIVGFREPTSFTWPLGGVPMKPLSAILESEVHERYLASDRIRESRLEWHTPDLEPTIWHENKSGNVSKYPYSCALRAGASYNYLLVDGKRRLTDREMLRLQGFPDSFKIVCPPGVTRRQAGNSVAVPVVSAVLEAVLNSLDSSASNYSPYQPGQPEYIFERAVS